MEKDSFKDWFNTKTSRTNKLLILLVGAVSLVATLITAILKISKATEDIPKAWNDDVFVIVNFVLHLLIISVVLLWGKPRRITHSVIEINQFNKSKTLSFLKTDSSKELDEKFSRANSNVFIYFKHWRKIWLSWLGLYFIVLISHLLLKSANPKVVEFTQYFFGVLENLFNNSASLMIIYCFIVLSKQARIGGDKKLEYDNLDRWLYGLIILTVIEVVVRFMYSPAVSTNQQYVQDYFNNNGAHSILNLSFAILSGMIAAVAIAQLIGRFDSKLISAPQWMLICLYGYAGLQMFIRDFHTDSSGYLMLIIIYAALLFKCIFLLFTFWLIETKRLFFYFLAVNRLQNHMSLEWKNIKETLIKEESSTSFDLNGQWQIIEEYEGGRTTGQVTMNQRGDELSGNIEISDWMDIPGGEVNKFVVKEEFTGKVAGINVSLEGTDYELLQGEIDDYKLDKWEGKLLNSHNIVGTSKDTAEVGGSFVMKRQH
ncbi:hypothetical protein [Roseivirga sp. E12]|uniref:hypothetical protein n=1 Tax=Roseivirga sp. E12 TaxID=2819237 RepID=UPI001ABCA44D|nr:hypothetical protein [Roseivirga sp. E12]MBO3697294.1 hypothetical protein [Roseivirga sp. E12]